MYTIGVTLQDMVDHIKRILGLTVSREYACIDFWRRHAKKKQQQQASVLRAWSMLEFLPKEIPRKKYHTRTFTIHALK